MRWAKADGVWFAREQLEVANGGVLYDQATFSEGDLGPPAKRQAKVRLDAPHRRPCMPSLVPRVPASALTPALFSRGRAHHVVQQGGDAPVRGRGPAARHGRCRERVLLALIAASGASKPHPAAVHLTRAGVIGSIAAFTLSPLSSLRMLPGLSRPQAQLHGCALRLASARDDGERRRRWRQVSLWAPTQPWMPRPSAKTPSDAAWHTTQRCRRRLQPPPPPPPPGLPPTMSS